MKTADDAFRIVHWTLVPGSSGELVAGLGYDSTPQHRDAADARGEAARLQRRVEELEALVADLDDHSRSMEGFAATVAHQLSEPLIVAESGTIMVAEDLGDALDPDLRARLDAIGRGAARARQMIDALLDGCPFGQRRRAPPGRRRRPSWRRCWRSSIRGSASAASSSTSATSRPSAPSRACWAIVYENLLSNALKYGPRDGGRVQIKAEPRVNGWRLIVASGGAPLPADQTKRIFEPWRRIPGERRAPGSGLGLAICARLVDRLGGTIGVEPTPEGNAFHFFLPAA